MLLLSVDPGKSSGWALWYGATLVSADVQHLSAENAWRPNRVPIEIAIVIVPAALSVVIEVPQVYAASKSKGDPNDLIGVAVCVGAWATLFPFASVRLVKPRDWKGQVPKAIDHRRMLERLSPDERSRIRSNTADCFDAISLGLWALGRKP